MGLTRTIEGPELFHMHIFSSTCVVDILPWLHKADVRSKRTQDCISFTNYLCSNLTGYADESMTCRGTMNGGLLQVLSAFQPHGYLTGS